MSEIFLKLLNMSIAASYVILAVLLLRLLLKKAPKWISVLLWGIVAFRLICPVSFESIFSLIPSAETVSPSIMTDAKPEIHTGISFVNSAVNPVISQSFAPKPTASANPLQIWTAVASIVWLTGMLVMIFYMAISYFLLHRKVRTAVRFKENIFQSETVDSPFVLGLFKPRIYLPFAIGEADLSYVVAHEEAHIRRKDHLWKPIGFLLLTVYWFNPLLWLGYILLCRDIEFACDEKVIREMDSQSKADYSQALVSCSVHRRRIAACPLAFGEVGVKARIRSVMYYKKPAFWIILIALISCIVVAICFLTNPKTKDEPTDAETDAQTHATIPSDEMLPTATIPPNVYVVEALPYECSIYSFAITPGENSPIYAISEDMELSEQIQQEGKTLWEKLGQLTPIELTQENFDNRCLMPSSWVEGYDAPTIRENNRQAWQLINGITRYTLLLQKNGDIYLAYGYEKENNDHIRWLFKLAPGMEKSIRLLQYTWDGWGISFKTVVAGDVGNRILDALKAMPETGEIAPKISDDVLETGGGQYPVDRGTMWIEWDDRIWRLSLEPAQLCLVETHLGEGKILEMSDGFLKDVNDAWHYAPYDYYKGTYRSGEETLKLENVFSAETTVSVKVKNIRVESNHDPHNTITLELTSTVDQTADLKLHCQQSDDNLTWGDSKTVELKKGIPTVVQLQFGGWKNTTYWVYIEIANTKAEITIDS